MRKYIHIYCTIRVCHLIVQYTILGMSSVHLTSTYRGRGEIGGVYLSALSAGAYEYTTTLNVIVDIVQGGESAPHPPSPAWVDFTLMMECTPESGRCHSVYSVVRALRCHSVYSVVRALELQKSILFTIGQGKCFFTYFDFEAHPFLP
jgi:hypothetical protein